MAISLISSIRETKVSSVLNNDRKVYGKKFLFDGKDETCWNSDQGSPQWIHFTFPGPVTLTGLKLQFQGGFAGRECELGILPDHKKDASDSPPSASFQFSAEDNNSLQEFQLKETPIQGTYFYLKFSSSTDFYGRIILYNFDILGKESIS